MGSWGRLGAVVAALGCLLAACGDNDVVITRHGGGVPAGFFIGRTSTRGDLSLAVETIRSVFFVCGDTSVFQLFDPAEPIAGDGSFAVELESGGRTFIVSGRFVSDDKVEGSIDGDAGCDGDFSAQRCNPKKQDCGDDDGDTVPNEVDPDQGGATPTPIRTPTPTGATPTPTEAGATPTVTQTPNPTPTATPSGLCGNGEIDGDEECDGANLDEETCFDLCFDQEDEGGILTCNGDCTFNFSQCLGQDCSP